MTRTLTTLLAVLLLAAAWSPNLGGEAATPRTGLEVARYRLETAAAGEDWELVELDTAERELYGARSALYWSVPGTGLELACLLYDDYRTAVEMGEALGEAPRTRWAVNGTTILIVRIIDEESDEEELRWTIAAILSAFAGEE
ncbi:MAG: hypothetical protein GF403_06060 [Candidatus Coatesbacteria bacterium]|nr:hypothetical protein [Candidatus Coatesbacteria bacterium]